MINPELILSGVNRVFNPYPLPEQMPGNGHRRGGEKNQKWGYAGPKLLHNPISGISSRGMGKSRKLSEYYIRDETCFRFRDFSEALILMTWRAAV